MDWDWLPPVSLLEQPLSVFKFFCGVVGSMAEINTSVARYNGMIK